MCPVEQPRGPAGQPLRRGLVEPRYAADRHGRAAGPARRTPSPGGTRRRWPGGGGAQPGGAARHRPGVGVPRRVGPPAGPAGQVDRARALRRAPGAAGSRSQPWLAAFGPGTATDLRWWTGWTAGEVKRALARVGAVAVALDGAPGYVLPDDVDPVPAGEPWAALLPALDPTPMGWAGREWFLGAHRTAIFDRTGNIGPSVWWDGRVVGGWAQRGSGEIALRLLEDVGAEATAAIAATAQRLGAWLGPVRVTPRFRTPLERELSGRAPE
ncbi:MAG TPA: crosslink repair DNA glycosylase YcaQ family protein [Micromonosporaceae bacterium]|nr:crosslink repair DNA glycosylase YcaQ family protein [Micromonosporaceae bacterium]